MEDEIHISAKAKRIRFIKKILRYMPRRASIHRYPVLKHFAGAAKKRPYLWSFRVNDTIPSFYLGWIITFIPLPFVLRVFLAFVSAVLCRANMAVLVCLQAFTNIITFLFLWPMIYKFGFGIVSFLGSNFSKVAGAAVANGEFKWTIGNCIRTTMRWFAISTIGAIVLGSVLGFLSAFAYKFFAKRAKIKPGNGLK